MLEIIQLYLNVYDLMGILRQFTWDVNILEVTDQLISLTSSITTTTK